MRPNGGSYLNGMIRNGNIPSYLVVAGVIDPTNSDGFDPFVKFPWSRELRAGWSMGGMQSLFYATESGRRNATWEPAFYLEREVTKHSDAFVEYVADYPHSGDALLAWISTDKNSPKI
jgi:hypothetical protein